ncbi:MAG TPA: carboxyltransferase domain-containing protein [Ilumatobacteraceae bacterium]|nr:carboxyltransferase domain-containing protein [Ilumatobacteraceae bacterium]
MRRHPYGPVAWLVDDVSAPAAWANALRTMEVPGVEEIVPAESTVVVRCVRDRHDAIGEVLDLVVPAAHPPPTDPALTIDVVYDGPDIGDLAYAARVTVDDVVRLHATGTYEVAFCGFSPGFGYLRGIDPRLHVPRRGTPRISVPAGAVGIAAGYTCVYPSASPGGWYLIGHATARLWDADRDPPALLTPGRSVRFRRVAA